MLVVVLTLTIKNVKNSISETIEKLVLDDSMRKSGRV